MLEAPIGILGGTFDPVHSAHLALAETAREQLRLERVLWIPAGRPRHRDAPAAAATDRLAMVRIAIAGRPGCEADDAEVLADAPSYMAPTLERLRAAYGERRPLVLLMGADAFLGLPSWHRWRELFRLAHLAVATRPGFSLAAESLDAALADEFRRRCRSQFTALAAAPAGAIFPFELSAGTVSASEVRARLKAGEDVGRLLPAGVFDYIRNRHLYGT